MTHLTPIKRQILVALRDHEGHLDAGEVARIIGEAPFRVRAELNDLRGRRYGPLVRETWIRRRLEYELTPAGEAASFQEVLPFGPDHE